MLPFLSVLNIYFGPLVVLGKWIKWQRDPPSDLSSSSTEITMSLSRTQSREMVLNSF